MINAFKYFYSYLRWRLFLLVTVSVLVGLLDGLGLAMFLPLLEPEATASADKMGNLGVLVDGLEAMGLSLTLTVVLLTMLGFFTLKGIAKYALGYLTTVYQQFFIRTIRIKNIDAITNYSYHAFVTADAGAIQNTLSGEVERVVQSFRRYMKIMEQAVLVTTYALLAFLANPEFAALVVVAGVLSNFLFSVLYKKTKALSRKLVRSNHDFQGLLIQKVAFFKYLRATAGIHKYAATLREKVYEIEDRVRKMGILNAIMQGVREPLMIGLVVAVILIQVNWLGGALSTIILSLLFFYRGLTSVMGLQTSYNAFLSFSGSLDSMQAFWADLHAHQAPEGSTKPQPFERQLELEDVSFSYTGTENILSDINLRLYKGETLALIGESGSGKTTVMNILSGLLQPTEGRFTIDGVDSRELRMSEIQSRIGYITQEPVIFDDSVYNNVTFWAPHTPENEAKFWQALDEAQMRDFVDGLPAGPDARLGNNGINISGGQKQRISIARELYKNVDFLFMDEATSALDSETEKAIQRSIEGLQGHYTIVIIAHRLATVKHADRIVVMKEGRVEQQGTYGDLLENSRTFNRMIRHQVL